TTPRSYSRRILKAHTSRMKRTSSAPKPKLNMINLRSWEPLSGLGHDLEKRAVHCDDAHALARPHWRRAANAPGLAVDARPALRFAVLERLAGAAEELFAPAHDRAPMRFHRHADDQEQERRSPGGEPEHEREGNAEAGNVGIDEDDRADDERDRPADPERSVCWEKQLSHHEGNAHEHKRKSGIVHRQKVERVERDQHADRADDSRKHQAGVGKLEYQSVDPEKVVEVGDD